MKPSAIATAFLLLIATAAAAADLPPVNAPPSNTPPADAPTVDTPPVVLLWPNGAPHSEGKTADQKVAVSNGERVVTGVNKPNLTVFLPDKTHATGVGVLIAPGGGHYKLSYDSEGCNVGRWLADRGIAGFVLTYRLAKEQGSTYTIDGDELPDTQRAMRLIRSRAVEWTVDPAKLGMIGFSAGGELVNLLVQKNDNGNPAATDPIDQFGCKPAFQGLMYPGNAKAIAPTKDSPPAFLLCGAADRPEISETLASAYLLFKHAGVPVELHIYANTAHGFGYRPRSSAASNEWPWRFQEWLATTGFLKKTQLLGPAWTLPNATPDAGAKAN